MDSVEEAIETTQVHIDGFREMKTQLKQFKGRIQTIRSLVKYLQENREEFSPEIDPNNVADAQTEVERIADVIDHLTEQLEDARDVARNMNTLLQMAQKMTNSLTKIDEGLPKTLESLDNNYQDIQGTMEKNHDIIEPAISILERFPIIIIDSPDS
jgi:hypothetical protein